MTKIFLAKFEDLKFLPLYSESGFTKIAVCSTILMLEKNQNYFWKWYEYVQVFSTLTARFITREKNKDHPARVLS